LEEYRQVMRAKRSYLAPDFVYLDRSPTGAGKTEADLADR